MKIKFFIIRLINKLGLLKMVNVLIPKEYNNQTIQIPILYGNGYNNLYLTEIWMCSLLNKILPLKKGTFIDVGVNVGQTLIKLRSVNPDIPYVGFEPNPSCIYYTQQLIKNNQYKNCRLIPAGLFDNDSILELNIFHEKSSTDESASLIKEFRPDEKVERSIFVPVFRFESANKILNIDQIAVIKIDVEGAELEVLNSLLNAIKTHRPLVMMEILPCYSHENAFRIDRQKEIEGKMEKLDYKIIRVLKLNNDKIEKLELIDTIGVHSNREWCEYVMAPAELSEQILSFSF